MMSITTLKNNDNDNDNDCQFVEYDIQESEQGLRVLLSKASPVSLLWEAKLKPPLLFIDCWSTWEGFLSCRPYIYIFENRIVRLSIVKSFPPPLRKVPICFPIQTNCFFLFGVRWSDHGQHIYQSNVCQLLVVGGISGKPPPTQR